jgi:hypothetical protein
MIFKKSEYIIICDTDSYKRVMKFAERHCAKGTTIEVRGHGSLLDNTALHRVKFKTWEPRKIVNMSLRDTFARTSDVTYGLAVVSVKEKES